MTLPVLTRLSATWRDHVRRHRETDALEAAVAAENRGVDANELAVDVDERAAGVAGIDRGVGLDEVFIALDVGEDSDAAALGADDAARDSFADAERIADREHAVTDLYLGRVGERDGGEVVGVDLDDGDIGLLVTTDELGDEVAAVGQRDGDGLGAIHDVVVGRDVAVGANDHARAAGRPAGPGAFRARRDRRRSRGTWDGRSPGMSFAPAAASCAAIRVVIFTTLGETRFTTSENEAPSILSLATGCVSRLRVTVGLESCAARRPAKTPATARTPAVHAAFRRLRR